MLMIKMQLEDYMFLEVHSNLLHISFQKEKLEIDIVHALLYGYSNTIGLNIVSRKILCFVFIATCSKTKKKQGEGDKCIYCKRLEKLEYGRADTS